MGVSDSDDRVPVREQVPASALATISVLERFDCENGERADFGGGIAKETDEVREEELVCTVGFQRRFLFLRALRVRHAGRIARIEGGLH